MPLPLHGHRRRPPPPRRRVHGVSSGLGTSTHLVGCLVLLLIAFVVLAAFLLHRASSSSARSGHHHREEIDGRIAALSITIFSAPLRPPEGSPARQELAVRSWLALPGEVTVVLLGSHPSALPLAKRLGRRVTVEAAVDSSFTGTPFFHSMVARAQAAGTDICVLVDAEIVLLPETVTLLTDLSRIDRDWLLVSASRNVSRHRHNLANNGIEPSFKMLEEIQAGNLAADGSDRGLVFAWNNPGRPLLAGVVPSFLYGRGAHSRWLAHEVLSSQMRLVFDASSLVLGLYPEDFSAKIGMGSSSGGRPPGGSWEFGVSRHLALVYGSYCYHPPGGLHSPMLYEVLKHSEDYMLSKVEEPTFSRFFIGNKEQNVNTWNKEDNCLSDHLRSYSSEASDVPYSLETLLRFVADGNRSVVLGVAGTSYRDMLMSWVCRLRHLGVTNFVVCALDQGTYEFSVLQGLPVFRDPSSPKNVSFDDCHYGTQCFKRVTKVKSRIVLEILRMGYNVLLSDVDVYWFRNPVNFLYSLGPATFAAQSDEYNETGPINMPRRLNSGFYYARSDNATIAAMKMVVKHATKSNSSEQPSFYDILCGKEGANRLANDRCLEPSTNLTVVFLDRDLFPNGAYKGLWERNDIRSACRKLGCFIIHNNWVNGRKKKFQRQMASGLWDYDPSSRMCLQSWGEASNSRTIRT